MYYLETINKFDLINFINFIHTRFFSITSFIISAIPRELRGIALQFSRHTPISGRVDRASAIETVDSGSITARVKPKTIKIGIHSFSVDVQQMEYEAPTMCD